MSATVDKSLEHAWSQAKCQVESIREMVKGLDAKEEEAQEEAEQAIQEDALSVEVRTDWHEPGTEGVNSEFYILLCTGGPAVRLIGELDQWKQPDSVQMQCQDWGTPWTEYPLDAEEEAACLQYSQQFYFGE